MFGAFIGDICGSIYEFNNIKTKRFPLVNDDCFITDDSVMTSAVIEICNNGYLIDKKSIISIFKKWGNRYPYAGYGTKFERWVLSEDSKPYNSCGNGSAMRISPIGWIANSEDEVIKYSKAVTEVTHNHKEGIKGAEVTAMCVYYARIGKSKDFIKEYIKKYYDIDFDYETLKKTYAHGKEICQVTVPQALYCFLISTSFVDCLRTTISIGGDCDTTAAISCAVAEAYYGIPTRVINEFKPFIPNDMLEEIRKFEERYGNKISKRKSNK